MDLVPFNTKWAGSETKLDLKAWYRRPSAHGGFSMSGPLPLRRHLDWQRKGFEYVTLGTGEDFSHAAAELRASGADVSALAKAYDHRGVFKMADYLKDEKAHDAAYLAELQAKVDKFGADTVTEMMRVGDPAFVLPESVVEPVKVLMRVGDPSSGVSEPVKVTKK